MKKIYFTEEERKLAARRYAKKSQLKDHDAWKAKRRENYHKNREKVLSAQKEYVQRKSQDPAWKEARAVKRRIREKIIYDKKYKSKRVLLTPEQKKQNKRIRDRNWKAKNREKVKINQNRYIQKKRETNPEFLKEKSKRSYRRLKDRNPNAVMDYIRSRYEKDPYYKFARNMRAGIIGILKRSRVGKFHRSIRYLGCTFLELKSWIESQFRDGMSWSNNGGDSGWELDHKIPVSSFDFSDEPQIFKCFHYSNLQPLWKHENRAKGSKLDWSRELPA